MVSERYEMRSAALQRVSVYDDVCLVRRQSRDALNETC